jgi:hypothetical protein
VRHQSIAIVIQRVGLSAELACSLADSRPRRVPGALFPFFVSSFFIFVVLFFSPYQLPAEPFSRFFPPLFSFVL